MRWLKISEIKSYYKFHCQQSGERESLTGWIRYFRYTVKKQMEMVGKNTWPAGYIFTDIKICKR